VDPVPNPLLLGKPGSKVSFSPGSVQQIMSYYWRFVRFLQFYSVIVAVVIGNATEYEHTTASKLSTLKVGDNTAGLHCNATFIF
jgi:hypothetical protein